jgi:DNA-binding transcriptional MerR regulator
MTKDIFTLKELISKTGSAPRTIKEWIKLKLVAPSGFTEDKDPLFSEIAVDRIAYLRKLEELGYGLEDLQRIVKKVGLPQERHKNKESGEQAHFLTVGSLAERSGVSPRTIKHWEDKGIIEPDRRSEGGFRLYSRVYIYLCKLIQDLQLFGCTLEEIKTVSGYFRDFLAIQKNLTAFSKSETLAKLEKMLEEIKTFFDKMRLFQEGIDRWEDLLKKKKREILSLKGKNHRRSGS